MGYQRHIEYTNLKSPSSKEIRTIVQTANERDYFGVCLNYECLSVANKYKGENLKLVTVAGFPPIHSYRLFADGKNKQIQLALGLYSKGEIDNIKWVIDSGLADEIDLVFPIYWYVTGHFLKIHKFLKGIRNRYDGKLKVICELGTIFNQQTALYEIVDLLRQAGIDYFKTNTGLIKQDFDSLLSSIMYCQMVMNDFDITMDIKASGGIKTKEQANKLLEIGVKRIGTSALI